MKNGVGNFDTNCQQASVFLEGKSSQISPATKDL
jgi:hypothetical protein